MSNDARSGPARSEFLPGASYHFLTPFYELLAKPMLASVWRDVIGDVKKLAEPMASVVDLGCGPATVLRELTFQRPDLVLTGVDIDKQMLSIARRRLPGVRFLESSIDAIPLEDASADVVMTSMVFHHLPRPIKQGALREAKRILQPNGVFMMCDFSTPVNRLGNWLVHWFGKLESGVAAQGAGELMELASSEGLTMIPRWTRLGCITQHEVKRRE